MILLFLLLLSLLSYIDEKYRTEYDVLSPPTCSSRLRGDPSIKDRDGTKSVPYGNIFETSFD